MTQERIGFNAPSTAGDVKKATKLDSSNSVFANMPKRTDKDAFDAKASVQHEKMLDRKQRGADLAKQFWDVIQDKTLLENKGPIKTNIEKELVGKLVEYAAEVNSDENEQEGMGALALIVLLFKTVMSQRDRIVSLEYKLTDFAKKD